MHCLKYVTFSSELFVFFSIVFYSSFLFVCQPYFTNVLMQPVVVNLVANFRSVQWHWRVKISAVYVLTDAATLPHSILPNTRKFQD